MMFVDGCPHCESGQLYEELLDVVCLQCGWRRVSTLDVRLLRAARRRGRMWLRLALALGKAA